MSSAKWRPFFLGFNVLRQNFLHDLSIRYFEQIPVYVYGNKPSVNITKHNMSAMNQSNYKNIAKIE